jgi:hypothetical protein
MNQMKTHYSFTAQIEKDKETGLYVGMVPNLPGAYTQATSLDELQGNRSLGGSRGFLRYGLFSFTDLVRASRV